MANLGLSQWQYHQFSRCLELISHILPLLDILPLNPNQDMVIHLHLKATRLPVLLILNKATHQLALLILNKGTHQLALLILHQATHQLVIRNDRYFAKRSGLQN